MFSAAMDRYKVRGILFMIGSKAIDDKWKIIETPVVQLCK